MADPILIWRSVTAAIVTLVHGAAGERDDTTRDRGAVSIEQVLWYAAAAISVAVVATIIWTQVRNTASTPVEAPTAP